MRRVWSGIAASPTVFLWQVAKMPNAGPICTTFFV